MSVKTPGCSCPPQKCILPLQESIQNALNKVDTEMGPLRLAGLANDHDQYQSMDDALGKHPFPRTWLAKTATNFRADPDAAEEFNLSDEKVSDSER